MDCPACGSPRSPLEKECPRCVYIANTLREHTRKQQEQKQQTPSPPRPALAVETPTPTMPLPAIAYETGIAQDATPSNPTAVISIMWTLTAVEIVLLLLGQLRPPTPFLLESPAFAMAILLVVSKNKSGRWNGGAKLALDIIAIVPFVLLWKTPVAVLP